MQTNICTTIIISLLLIQLGHKISGVEDTIFWLSSEIKDIDWRKGCLTTAGCAQPRFQLVLANTVTNEKMTKNWIITPQLMQERLRTLVTHWSDGNVSDIKLFTEVIGIDPTYGFPRICDSSQSVAVYHQKRPSPMERQNAIQQQSLSSNENDDDRKLIIELSARCFNCTVVVEYHPERCPWCEQDNPKDTVVDQQYGVEDELSSDTVVNWFGVENYLYAAIVTLAMITLLSTAICLLLLAMHLRHRRRRRRRCTKVSRVCSVYGNHMGGQIVHAVVPPNGLDDSIRYDAPWEHKYRPLPRWTSTRSSETSGQSPPNTSSTVTTGVLSQQISKVTLNSNGLQRLSSPDSSIYERPEDSGLESV